MVFGAVTDNASNMKKKVWLLVEKKYPTVICHGDAACGLNLIFCDMIKLETCKNIKKTSEKCYKRTQTQTHAS